MICTSVPSSFLLCFLVDAVLIPFAPVSRLEEPVAATMIARSSMDPTVRVFERNFVVLPMCIVLGNVRTLCCIVIF